ncbi:18360_t:CDS:2 [Acaulospora morrowiae]|uniref:18360_t:CDS:1 n=1 Tax=Acaulospora morrowiae TaxID=94023 RepID=A0A9N9G0C7_9GLOM|nr:18360_t:CDS:2 [Acaulospora morrowiae]
MEAAHIVIDIILQKLGFSRIIPLKPLKGWTSGNKNIDDYIKEFQLKATKYENVIEWIPFNRLSDLHKTGDSKLRAKWLDGIRKVENATQSRTLSCPVELEKFDSQIGTSELLKKLNNYMKSYDYKIYGITQDSKTSQYMIVFDSFDSRRDCFHGRCSQCERYNTSKAWCQSCDPFEITQGWTSENNDIDDYIKEYQLNTTKYEDIIEWIPFNRLSNLHKTGYSKLRAEWLDGIRKVENNTQLRTSSYTVELEKLNGSQVDTLEFTRKCKRYNTSEAWCRSCDPLKTTQGWTSGNKETDICIKEFQLKVTKYENGIEWIPFDRLYEVQTINDSVLTAIWLDGRRKLRNEGKSRKICTVILNKFLSFKKGYMCANKICGISYNPKINQYMIISEFSSEKHNRQYENYSQCNQYKISKSWCDSCNPNMINQGLSNEYCIREFKIESIEYKKIIEWIPYDKFVRMQNIGEKYLEFSITWSDVKRDFPEILKESCTVLLKVLPHNQLCFIEFLQEFKSYIKLDKNRINICERRQITNTSKYMIAFEIHESSIDEFASKRDFNYGQCTNCKRYNTSRAWCQSCDPWKMIRGWTSENVNINNCIMDFQFEATEYGKVIDWIPFDRLNDVKEIGRGGFGCVYSATWLDGKRRILYENGKCVRSHIQKYTVALKTLSDSSTNPTDFLREVETPHFYVALAKQCMDSNPQKRLAAKAIYKQLEEWYSFMDKVDELEIDEIDESEIDLDQLNELNESEVEICNKFWEADEIAKQLPLTLQKHQDAAYTSRYIDTYSIAQRYNKSVSNSADAARLHEESVSASATDSNLYNYNI